MDELELIVWILLVVGTTGAVAAFLGLGGAWVVQRIQLLLLDVEARRVALTAQIVGVDLLRMDLQSKQVDVSLKNEIIRPDENGLLPVSRAQIDSSALAEAVVMAMHMYIDAQRPAANVPHTLHWAPHIKYDTHFDGVESDEPAAAAAALISLDFWQLYEAGQLPANKFLIGFDLDDGQPILADWTSLYSALIGGQSGSGKSTLIRNVLAQSAMQGGRFAIIDPHYAAGEESLGASLMPLRRQMLFDIAATDEQMSQTIRYVADVGQRRISGKEADRTPLVLVVDETTALLSRSNIASELLGLLKIIAQETRKVGVYAMCIGQQFSAETMPTTARNSFVSMLSCRARRDVARVQSGNAMFGRIAETLIPGQAVWMTPKGEVKKLAVPNTTQRHLEAVSNTLANRKDSANIWFTHEETTLQNEEPVNHAETSNKPAINQAANSPALDTKELRALAMFQAGSTIKEIIGSVYGATTGMPYTKAVAEFTNLLRGQIGGVQRAPTK